MNRLVARVFPAEGCFRTSGACAAAGQSRPALRFLTLKRRKCRGRRVLAEQLQPTNHQQADDTNRQVVAEQSDSGHMMEAIPIGHDLARFGVQHLGACRVSQNIDRPMLFCDVVAQRAEDHTVSGSRDSFPAYAQEVVFLRHTMIAYFQGAHLSLRIQAPMAACGYEPQT